MAIIGRLRALNERTKDLQQRVHREGFSPHLPLSLILDDPPQAEELVIFLSEHLDLLDGLDVEEGGYLSASGDEGTLSLARGFRIDESKELMAGAANILNQSDTQLVLMGHTHEALDRPGRLAYLNTGSWTRYYTKTESEKLRPWSLLKAGKNNEFPYALKYAEVHAGSVGEAQLKEYSGK
jgi:hypothetical protein